jgi:hypothetical protein
MKKTKGPNPEALPAPAGVPIYSEGRPLVGEWPATPLDWELPPPFDWTPEPIEDPLPFEWELKPIEETPLPSWDFVLPESWDGIPPDGWDFELPEAWASPVLCPISGLVGHTKGPKRKPDKT